MRDECRKRFGDKLYHQFSSGKDSQKYGLWHKEIKVKKEIQMNKL